MLPLNVWILLFSVSGYFTNQGNIQVTSHEVTGRLGFGILDSFRKMFCRSFCNPIDGNPYIVNLSCAIKCPELYLPNHTTPSSSEKPTSALPPSGTSQEPAAASTGKPPATEKPSGESEKPGNAGTEKPTAESGMPGNAATEKPTAESKKPENAGSEMPSAGETTAAPSGGMTNPAGETTAASAAAAGMGSTAAETAAAGGMSTMGGSTAASMPTMKM